MTLPPDRSCGACWDGAIALLTDTGVLAATPLFAELTDEQRKLIAFGARRRAHRPGDVLYEMDRPAEGATVILRGRVELTDGDSGWEVGPGTLLDELALLTRRRHAFGAFALSDVEVLPIERTLFRRLVEEYPDIATRVRARISARLAALAEQMDPIVRRMEEADRLLDARRAKRS